MIPGGTVTTLMGGSDGKRGHSNPQRAVPSGQTPPGQLSINDGGGRVTD